MNFYDFFSKKSIFFHINMVFYKCFFLVCVLIVIGSTDKPCAPRRIAGRSTNCVCNSTYCDTVTRVPPEKGYFMSYTSSESGLRFMKSRGELNSCNVIQCPPTTLKLDPDTRYQFIEGFGGAVTDAAGINWKNVSETLQKMIIDSYFSNEGIEYNMIRVPIGGSDFSTHPYAYNEMPINDLHLSNFSLTVEDFKYKIPMIKQAIKTSKEPIHVLGTTWSPPVWMKTNNRWAGISRLKPEYYQTYADYHYKFIEHYAAEGIPIWGLTTTNEPTNGLIGVINFNCLGWTAAEMGKWITNNLGPTIKNSTLKDVKILVSDDQRLTLPYFVTILLREHPGALNYLDGVAVHFYTDFITPKSIITDTMGRIPDKFIMSTEACEGSSPWQTEKVELGSWRRAYTYISDIITNLNYNFVGWMDWNLCLNLQGGPNWAKNNVDSPIIVSPETGEFYKQPMFYAIGHFSKFIPRGSQRIHVIQEKSIFKRGIENVAFVTPRKSIVLVMYNSGSTQTVNVKIGDELAFISAPEKSVITVEFPYDG